MASEGPHPLLAQIPLTVNRHIQTPRGVSLPYTWRQTPTSLPPSILSNAPASQSQSANPDNGASTTPALPKFILSPSGQAHSPTEILANYATLTENLAKTAKIAEQNVKAWEKAIQEADLAERRRVAPGWLDSQAKLLVPETKAKAKPQKDQATDDGAGSLLDVKMPEGPAPTSPGEELDKAFGMVKLD